MKPIRLFATVAILVGIGIAMAQAQVPITAKNWLTHPEIKKIRSVYQEVTGLLKVGGLRREIRRFEYCDPNEGNLRERYTDASGVVRKYVLGGGSDDSSVTLEHTYDSQGRLRFVLVQAGAVNGSQYLYRIYFNEQGKRIWENRKLVSGPGYPFGKTWPDGAIVRTPNQAFKTDSPCKEISANSNRVGSPAAVWGFKGHPGGGGGWTHRQGNQKLSFPLGFPHLS